MAKAHWRRIGLAVVLCAVAAATGVAGAEQQQAGAGAACAPPPQAPPVRVLAFGDSLTNGAVPSRNANHPYALKLGEVLRAELAPRAVDVAVVGARNF